MSSRLQGRLDHIRDSSVFVDACQSATAPAPLLIAGHDRSALAAIADVATAEPHETPNGPGVASLFGPLASLLTGHLAAAPNRVRGNIRLLSAALRWAPGCKPTPVAGGGPNGAGDVHYALGSPVGFVGVAGPQQRFGSTTERLPESPLRRGVDIGAEVAADGRGAQ